MSLPELNRARRGHSFYPEGDLPALYATDGTPVEAKHIVAHYFSPNDDWYVAEFDPETGLAFGYAKLGSSPDCAEWGYVDLTELEETLISPFGLVERDIHWTTKSFWAVAL